MGLIFSILIGLAIGSFLNVCISRMPHDESVVHPRSRCPQCKKLIAGYDNIPVLSYILLGGKCRNCKKKISIRYPLIETLTAVISVLIFMKFDLSREFAVYFALSAALIVLAFIDVDHRILPNPITLNGIWIGILASFFVTVPSGLIIVEKGFQFLGTSFPSTMTLSVGSSVLGALVGGGILWGIGEAYFRIRGVEGMGFGDVKMMAMVGAFLGAPLTILTIMIGSLLGSIIGLVLMKFAGKDEDYELPFGTFLSFASIVALLYGNTLIELYKRIAFPGSL
jgi:leader peptidase (prepilin peptidase)/N-methyltransferase